MAKVGTAHIEIKPVLNEEALEALVQRIEDAVAEGVSRALNAQHATSVHVYAKGIADGVADGIRLGSARGAL